MEGTVLTVGGVSLVGEQGFVPASVHASRVRIRLGLLPKHGDI